MALNQAFGVQMHSSSIARACSPPVAMPIATANEALSDLTGVIGIDNSVSGIALRATDPSRTPVGAQTPPALQARYDETLTAITQPGGARRSPSFRRTCRSLTTRPQHVSGRAAPAGVTALAAGQYTRSSSVVRAAIRAPDAYGENVLDAEMVLATAPFANIVQVFTATNGAGLFTDGISYIVNQHAARARRHRQLGHVRARLGGQMPVMNALFAQAKAEGQQWFFASGDTRHRRLPRRHRQQDLLGRLARVEPVRRRRRRHPAPGDGGEGAWIGAGGGVSESLDKPAFQIGATPPTARATSRTWRRSPAATAWRSSVDRRHRRSSAPAPRRPIWAGLWAVIVQQKAPTGKGFTNALESIYTLAKASNGFHDITTGNAASVRLAPATGGYTAAAGYDLATGWGTPNLTSI